jgi:hypothetical protein
MEQHAAAEHLQVIRTLMERSALYRRTLAPIMLYVGAVGTLAGAGGLALGVESVAAFGAWWLAAAVAALSGAFVAARRQALGDGEPFWSPPTLRVAQAMAPPLVAGFIFSVATLLATGPGDRRWLFVIPNALFYGCAVHATGFFMPRGMKLFGWLIISLTGVTLLTVAWVEPAPSARLDHAFMGLLFGLLHLGYGLYLYVTEPRKRPA